VVGSLVYSAVGTQNVMGAGFKEVDVTKLKLGFLMRSNDPPPTADQAKSDAATSLGQKYRASLLDSMGLSEGDLGQMQSATRADLEDQISRAVHEQVLATPSAPTTGAMINMKV
jgi:hypothetical protein